MGEENVCLTLQVTAGRRKCNGIVGVHYKVCQKPYSRAGLSTRIRLRTVSSGAQSSNKSRMSTFDGGGFRPGCRQLLAHTQRSGLCLANARASTLTSSERGAPGCDVSYRADR